MKIINFIGEVASFLKWAGVLAIGVNYEDSHWVASCLAVAIFGMVADKLIRTFINKKVNELNQVEWLERSYLNAIKTKVEKCEVVGSKLMQRSTQLGKEADTIYEAIYGFPRSAAALGIRISIEDIQERLLSADEKGESVKSNAVEDSMVNCIIESAKIQAAENPGVEICVDLNEKENIKVTYFPNEDKYHCVRSVTGGAGRAKLPENLKHGN